MKKITIGFVAMMLVLCLAQGAMAKINATAGISIGRESRFYDIDDGDRTHEISGFTIELFGDIYLANRISVGLGASTLIGSWKDSQLPNPTNPILENSYRVDLYGKYDLIVGYNYKVGAQVGVSYDRMKTRMNTYNSVFIAPGVFGSIELLPKLNLSADIKIPLGVWYTLKGNPTDAYFFKLFLIDAKIDLTYEVMTNVNVGIEAKIGNVNAYRIDMYKQSLRFSSKYVSKPAWNIGLKAEYKF